MASEGITRAELMIGSHLSSTQLTASQSYGMLRSVRSMTTKSL